MAATPTSTIWRIADAKMEGRLAERLAELRADDRSWRWIARKIKPELGFVVSHETLRSWGETLALPERTGPDAVAS